MSAPVTLISGLPGNGKTLYALCMIKEKAEKENRQVYYSGIEILDKQALPWVEIDPLKWFEMPAGAIIVLDEAHKVFPLRPVGSAVPPHVLPIAELRHDGHDVFLITQDGMELDATVRRRIGRHMHCVRRMGLEACAIREWPRFEQNAAKTNKGISQQHEWVYNKAAYAWYKSAEIHTIKRRIPPKLLWLVAALVMIPVALVVLVRLYNHLHSGEAIKKAVEANGAASGVASGGVGGLAGRQDDPAAYLRRYRPRVLGLDYTAQVYDRVTEPTHAPYPAACVESKSRCTCYSQQATKLDVSADLCHQIVAGGFFVAWDEKHAEQVIQPSPVVAPAEHLGGGNPDGWVSIGHASGSDAPAPDVAPAVQHSVRSGAR